MSTPGKNSPSLPPIQDFKTLNIQIKRLAQRVFALETGDPPPAGSTGPANLSLPGGPNDPLNIYVTPSSAPVVTPVPFDNGPLTNNLEVAAFVTINGPSSGTFTWVMPIQEHNLKVFLGLYGNYSNQTANTQSITFPAAFAFPPHLLADASSESGQPAATKTITNLNLPVNMGGGVTGWLVIVGW